MVLRERDGNDYYHMPLELWKNLRLVFKNAEARFHYSILKRITLEKIAFEKSGIDIVLFTFICDLGRLVLST